MTRFLTFLCLLALLPLGAKSQISSHNRLTGRTSAATASESPTYRKARSSNAKTTASAIASAIASANKPVAEHDYAPYHSLPEGWVYCKKCGFAHPFTLSAEESEALLNGVEMDPEIADYYAKFPLLLYQTLVYRGFQPVAPVKFDIPEYVFSMDPRLDAYDRDRYLGILYTDSTELVPAEIEDEILTIANDSTLTGRDMPAMPEEQQFELIPRWLSIAGNAQRLSGNLRYNYMVSNPGAADYMLSQLPVPPTLPEDDYSFASFLKSLNLPEVDKNQAIIPEVERRRINWLHTAGGSLQFSQAYISSNWYQGGSNYLALLFNFNWDVTLNTVFHPNLMFQSNLAYKLALNSNPKESLHSYSLSTDLLQYNLKAGIKALKKWFYSFNLQFKTQIFNSYPADSPNIASSFLSPGDLNLGIGMTYTLAKRKNTLKFNASISPLSYNLKTCISSRIDHGQFNIEPDRKTTSEIGSNAELTLNWEITPDISWRSRLFLFTDYKYFLGDWENTIVFNINRFLSTQIYLHPRYDSSSDAGISRWAHWSLKEILSFGLSYTFSTKP